MEKNETKNETENQNSENINALDEICKGACVGMDAIHSILEKVDNNDLREFNISKAKALKNIK